MLSEHEVFTEALKFSDAGERTAYLDRVCGADTSKRQRLNELLELHTRVDSVLEKRPQEIIEPLNSNLEPVDLADHEPAFNMAALKPYFEVPSHADSIGKLSHDELLEVLGQGGYGIVFKALDTKLNRLVAIKILSPHLAATSAFSARVPRSCCCCGAT